jgi:hypothetical protein
MRFLLYFAAFGCITQFSVAAPSHRFAGVVRRLPGEQSVVGVPVSAWVDLTGGRVDVLGTTRTRADGTFTLRLSRAPHGLYFVVWGWPQVTETSPSISRVSGGDFIFRRPRTDRFNLILVPRTFKPRLTPWQSTRIDSKRPNHAMERTATRCAFTFCIITTSSLRSTRALGGRRSSYSR